MGADVSLSLACLFLVLLFLLHFLKPELDPGWRWISEYEIGRFGWVMRFAFFSWGLSTLALAAALRGLLHSTPGVLGVWWLVVIAVALCGAGLFKTDPITHQTSSRENVIHAVCGAFVILTFPIVTTLVAVGLFRDVPNASDGSAVVLATVLAWFGLAIFLVSDIVAGRKVGAEGRMGDPRVRVGWQNRFMVVTYVTWVIVLSVVILRL